MAPSFSGRWENKEIQPYSSLSQQDIMGLQQEKGMWWYHQEMVRGL